MYLSLSLCVCVTTLSTIVPSRLARFSHSNRCSLRFLRISPSRTSSFTVYASLRWRFSERGAHCAIWCRRWKVMAFSGTQQKCKACDKTVYLVEQLTADGVVYHKACFRCNHCKGTLKVGVLPPFPLLRFLRTILLSGASSSIDSSLNVWHHCSLFWQLVRHHFCLGASQT